ncbi:MAG: formylglycine-generating enzyme family protein [Proteobacteria bacterium]|nr:formylglycine-generating enzyme family protein [Pseudomonadota bacterium]
MKQDKSQAEMTQKEQAIRSSPGDYELVLIPGGEFYIGSPKGEKGRKNTEGPRHKVRINDFYLGCYPVTNEEYDRFLEANPEVSKPEYWGNFQYNQSRQPVVGVSWDEAKQYCEWTGLRLPSEAEWEFACRAGTATRFYNGNDDSDVDRVAWHDKNSGARLHPVGKKEPNSLGLYDMHGNVWEWVEDDWHKNYKGAPVDGSPWIDRQRGNARVLRGGSFGDISGNTRCAFRYWSDPYYWNCYLGFRPAATLF